MEDISNPNICNTCSRAYSDGIHCNYLVESGFILGRDILGSHYKKNNQCPYYKAGSNSKSNYSGSLISFS